MKRLFVMRHDNPQRLVIADRAIAELLERVGVGQDTEVEIREPRRTLDANACMWATLGDIAKQLDWPHTDAAGKIVIGKMPAESWKAVLTAAFEQQVRQAQGLDGGMVMLGARTSQYSRKKMGEFIEFVHAEGSQRGVIWSAKAEEELATWAPVRRAA